MRLIGVILAIVIFVGLVFYILWSLDILKGNRVPGSQGSGVEDLTNTENQGGPINAAKNAMNAQNNASNQTQSQTNQQLNQ